MLLKTCHVSGMKILSNKRTLLAAYQVAGFRASARIEEYEHTPPAFVITLVRRQKKRCAAAAEQVIAAFMIGAGIVPETSIAATTRSISILNGVA
jgi:hypothetical protein